MISSKSKFVHEHLPGGACPSLQQTRPNSSSSLFVTCKSFINQKMQCVEIRPHQRGCMQHKRFFPLQGREWTKEVALGSSTLPLLLYSQLLLDHSTWLYWIIPVAMCPISPQSGLWKSSVIRMGKYTNYSQNILVP